MPTKTRCNLRRCHLVLVLAWSAFLVPSALAQGTAFTYQGQLVDNGQPAAGFYDLTFTLFANNQYGFPVGPVLTNLSTPVNAGLFTTTLNFGAVFNGSNYWLEIAVRTNGNGYFTILEPRQIITPVPYAVFSGNANTAVNSLTANSATNAMSVPAAGITGIISTANLNSNVAILTANGTLPTSVLPTNFAPPGSVSWQTRSSTAIQAQPNIGYILTNSQQVTITLPSSPNVGDIVEIVGAGIGGWVLAQNAGQTMAVTFTPLSLPGDVTGPWTSIAASSDGTKLAAAGSTGGIWTSSNSGANWMQTSAPTGDWQSIASSSDGTKLVAAQEGGPGGGIWTSSNSGTNWVQTGAPTNLYWHSIASSSDGTGLAAVITGGRIWASTNSGTNWTQTSAPTRNWYSIASSSDGTKLAALVSGGGIWISMNSGTNWEQAYAPTNFSYSIASSSDGTKLAAASSANAIWASVNSGLTWEQTGSATNLIWNSIASSLDGTKLAATEAYQSAGGIWISSNSGMTWTQTGAPNSASWNSIASSSDGAILAATINGGGIWTFVNGTASTATAPASGLTTPGTGGFLQGGFGGVVELMYAGGGQFIALYQTGSLSGH